MDVVDHSCFHETGWLKHTAPLVTSGGTDDVFDMDAEVADLCKAVSPPEDSDEVPSVTAFLVVGQNWPLSGKGSLILLSNILAGFGSAALAKGLGVLEFDLLECSSEYLSFLATHLPQLGLNNIPQKLWKSLFDKLVGQTFDASEFFVYAADEDSMCVVGAEGGIQAESDIFLLDHAITVKCVSVFVVCGVLSRFPRLQLLCRFEDLRKLLRDVPGAKERMERIIGKGLICACGIPPQCVTACPLYPGLKDWPVTVEPRVYPVPKDTSVVQLGPCDTVPGAELPVEAVYRNMWPILGSYRLASQSAVDSTPVTAL